MNTSFDIRQQLLANLQNKEYRDAFVEERIFARLPLKIRNLREAEGMTQQKMAAATGKKQTWISKLEDPNYGRFTLKTLLEMAHFFDVGLEVDFVPFSKLLTEVIHPATGAVPRFEKDAGLSGEPQIAAEALKAGLGSQKQNIFGSKGIASEGLKRNEVVSGEGPKPPGRIGALQQESIGA